MATTTRSALRQEVGLIAGSCKTGTASAAGAAGGTTIVDTTNFTDSFANANFYDGWYAIATSGTYAGQVRRVSSYAGATGTITVADAFGGQIASGVTFELHSYDPAELNNAINRALARCYYRTYFYPSLVTDGDMETSGTTNWTGSSSAATKDASVVKYGTQALVSTNSGANGYVRTASISVTPNDYYYVEVAVRPDNFAVSLVVYDVTNSAAITLSTAAASSGREWKRLWANFQTPSGCEQIQIRLTADSATAITYWDNLILQKVHHRYLALPSWVTESGNVAQVQYRGRGRTDTAETSGCEFLDEEDWLPVTPGPDVEQDRTAVTNALAIRLPSQAGYSAYRAKCVRQYDSLTSDTATTTAATEWVAMGAILELLRMGVLRAPGSQEGEFKSQVNAWKRDWMLLCRKYQPKLQQRAKSPWDA